MVEQSLNCRECTSPVYAPIGVDQQFCAATVISGRIFSKTWYKWMKLGAMTTSTSSGTGPLFKSLTSVFMDSTVPTSMEHWFYIWIEHWFYIWIEGKISFSLIIITVWNTITRPFMMILASLLKKAMAARNLDPRSSMKSEPIP